MFRLTLIVFIAIGIYAIGNLVESARLRPESGLRGYIPYTNSQWNYPSVSQGWLSANTAKANSPVTVKPRPQIDMRASDVCALTALNFAIKTGVQLNNNNYESKSDIFSPLSIMSSLSLLMLGAKARTYEQLSKLLGLTDDIEFRQNPQKFHEQFGILLQDVQGANGNDLRPLPNWRYTMSKNNVRGNGADRLRPVEHTVEVVNGLFTQIGYNLNPNYKMTVQSVYLSELAPLDFHNRPGETRDYINRWVREKTHEKIPFIIQDSIPRSTNLILGTAIYFKAFWENNFFEYATTEENFYPDGPNGKTVKAKMMATGGTFPFYQSAEYGCRIIGLPYMGNLTTMYVIQPNDSTREKLRAFQATLTAEIIEYLISHMQQSTALLAFPKMYFKKNINLRNVLMNLNVTDLFTSSVSDLSLIGHQMIDTRNPALTIGNTISGVQPDINADQPLIFTRMGTPDIEESQPLPNDNSTMIKEKTKRQAIVPIYNRNSRLAHDSLNQLENQRATLNNYKSDFFVEDIVHAVYMDVNESGTEAAAATLTYLKRSGTDVLFRCDTPFLIIVRHDPTKMPLFYGIINEPQLE